MSSDPLAELRGGVGSATPSRFHGSASPGFGLDISGRPAAKRVRIGSDARGRRLTDPMARQRNAAAAIVPRPFALNAKPTPRIHPGALLSSIQLADFFIVLLAGAVSLAVQPGLAWPLGALPAATGGLVLALMTRSLEPGPRRPQELLRRGLAKLIADGAVHALTAMAFALLVTVAVLQPSVQDRAALIEWLSLWAIGAIAGIGTVRIGLARLLARWRAAGRLKQTVAVYGTGDLAERLVERLRAASSATVEIVGVFDDRAARRISIGLCTLPQGTTAELVELSRQYEIDRIVVALPHSAEQRLLEILRKLHKMPVEISLAPDMVGFQIPAKDHEEFGGLPLLDVYGKPLSFGQSLLKTAFDRAAAAFGIIALSPLLLAVALAIKLDSKGPALFRQNRYGFGDRVIGVYKFRTMKAELADANGEKQTETNDPRLTRIGGLLRRLSIDELPQLLNVLRGELSLVGPRPHAVSMRVKQRRNEDIVPDYALRHHVKPGITGWAQVNGYHGPVATERALHERVAYDLDYINNWSLWFDIRILLRTLVIAFGQRHAY
jgi:Undecaprenyl-phosphate glucose phosphotransferase